MNVPELLDNAKHSCNAASDYALSKRLHVSKQAVSKWRLGHAAPDAVTCEKLAEITGIPLARVLGIVGEARAISAAEKRVWRRLAVAAIISIALTTPAYAATPQVAQHGHYAKYKAVFAAVQQVLARTFRRWLAVCRSVIFGDDTDAYLPARQA